MTGSTFMRKTSSKIIIFITTFLLSFTLLFSSSYQSGNFNRVLSVQDEVVVAEAATTSDYGSYYNDLDESLQGTAFRTQLASLITTTHKTQTTYDGLKQIFAKSDADPDKSGNIIWFYSGTTVPYDPTADMDKGSYPTNREHVWPKNSGNAFSAKSGPGSDSHHLRPANSRLNNARQDNSFGEVVQISSNIVYENGKTSYGRVINEDGSITIGNLCYQANETFYPGIGFRGATARILMYMQTRWGDANKLKFVLGNGNNKTIGDIATLMKWHYEEPPTESEIIRNNYVYSIQGNRNPFIDHPEYATKIYCYDGESYNSKLQSVAAEYDNYGTQETATAMTVEPNPVELNVGDTELLTVTTTPFTAKKNLTFKSSNAEVASVDTSGVITAKAQGTTTITVTETNSNISKTVSVTVYTDGITANTKNFKTLVTAAKANADKTQFYASLAEALNCYNSLSDEEKLIVEEKYQELIEYVSAYNQKTTIANNEAKDAIDAALSPLNANDKKKNAENDEEEAN